MIETKIRIIDPKKDAAELADILASGGAFPIVVTGSSMMPFLKESRDTVILQKKEQLKKGQIVFFRRNSGEFILHRIRKIYPNGQLLINGDAQSWCEVIHRNQVLAVVISVMRNGHNLNPNSIPSAIFRMLWYPTRLIRPYIWRGYKQFKKLFKNRNR